MGGHDADPNDVFDAGLVRLYAKDGADWNMFQQIDTPTIQNNRFGYSLDLSHDGSTLVVSALSRAVYIYELSNVTSVYDLLHTTADVNAAEVCISGDGSAIGVMSTSWSSSSGAMIFVRDGNGFQQQGRTFANYGKPYSGIALSYDGTIAAIGDQYWSNNRGRVGVFQWRDSKGDGSMEWMQMGSDITGDADYDYLGIEGCVSITHDGLTVAVGAEGYDRDGLSSRGLVRVFNYDSISDKWDQSGSDLVGDLSYDQLSKTALSSDGKYLAVGAYSGDYVNILENIGSNCEFIGGKVTSGEGRNFGFSIDISSDGAAVAIGDVKFDFLKGREYLLVRNNLTQSPSLVPTNKPSAIPSVSPSLAPNTSSSSISLPPPPSGSGNGGMYPFKKRVADSLIFTTSFVSCAQIHTSPHSLECPLTIMENVILSCYRVPVLLRDLASRFTSARRAWTANCSLTLTYPEPPWALETMSLKCNRMDPSS